MLADCFSILLAANKSDEFLVHEIRSFPLWDVSRLGDPNESRLRDRPVKLFTYDDWKYPIFFPPEYQCGVGDFIDPCGKSGLP